MSEGICFVRAISGIATQPKHEKMKMKTIETTAPNTASFYQEPTHDEIALAAFLQWEREGRQPGREMEYWCQAEVQMRSARLKKAEAAAAEASLPWPRPSRSVQVRKATTTVARKLTTAEARNVTPKTSVAKTAVLKGNAPKLGARRTA